MADKNPLLGNWKLKSYVVTTAAGERLTPYGENPEGYLAYSADQRMQVIGVADGRRALINARPTGDHRVALYDSMFAYSGTYRVEGGTVIHHVDISWNEVWSGTDQVRNFEVSGANLVLTTRIADSVSGAESLYELVWERVAGPR
jgi:hypothetical protein